MGLLTIKRLNMRHILTLLLFAAFALPTPALLARELPAADSTKILPPRKPIPADSAKVLPASKLIPADSTRKLPATDSAKVLPARKTVPVNSTASTSTRERLAAENSDTLGNRHENVENRPLTINEMRSQRGLTDTHNLFVPKGQWVFGGTASYSTHTNTGYQFLVVEGIDSKGYTFKISPMIAYAFHNNMALGGRFIYSRTLLKLDKASINFGDEDSNVNLNVQDYYALQHSYQVAAIWRQYIPLGRNKRFALFNEMSLAGGGTEARFANGSPVKGTYQTGYTFSLGISPGIIAFATNNMAVEVNVGVMGITFEHTEQVHNQVSVGERNLSQMNFKVNIFSIGLGVAFYL